jgi:hypothetical protein
MDFFTRVGGVLVAPRATMARLVGGEARARDVVFLLLGKLLAGELPSLVRAWLMFRDAGAGAGLQALFMVTRELLPDVLGILIAGVAMSFFVGKESRGYGRTVDVAAYAWIPYLAFELLAALFFSVRGVLPSPNVQFAVDALAVAWAVAVWTLGLVAARAPKEAT